MSGHTPKHRADVSVDSCSYRDGGNPCHCFMTAEDAKHRVDVDR